MLYAGDGQGSFLRLYMDSGRVALVVSDGETATFAQSGRLGGGNHASAVIVDAKARIITFVVDGVLWDGGEEARGWYRLASRLNSGRARENHEVELFRRPLRTAEAVCLTRGLSKRNMNIDFQ